MELYSNYFTHIVPCLFITINWFIGHRSLILCRTKYKIISKCSPQYIYIFLISWNENCLLKKKHVLKQLIFIRWQPNPTKTKIGFKHRLMVYYPHVHINMRKYMHSQHIHMWACTHTHVTQSTIETKCIRWSIPLTSRYLYVVLSAGTRPFFPPASTTMLHNVILSSIYQVERIRELKFIIHWYKLLTDKCD